MRDQVRHGASPRTKAFDDRALIFRGYVDDCLVKWLGFHAALFANDDLRLGNLELIALAAHIFYQDSDMEFSSAGNFEYITRAEVNAQSHIHLKLAEKPFSDLPRGNKFSFLPAEGRIICQKIKRDRRFINGDAWKWGGVRARCHRLADIDVGKTCDESNVPRSRRFGFYPLQPFEGEYF